MESSSQKINNDNDNGDDNQALNQLSILMKGKTWDGTLEWFKRFDKHIYEKWLNTQSISSSEVLASPSGFSSVA
jgi:hypothetical protein